MVMVSQRLTFKIKNLLFPLILDHSQDDSRGYYAGQAGDDGHGSHGGYQNGYGQQNTYVEVAIEPTEASLQGGETVNLTCQVKGTEQYTVTWGKYSHDTALPNYARVRLLNRKIFNFCYVYYFRFLARRQ